MTYSKQVSSLHLLTLRKTLGPLSFCCSRLATKCRGDTFVCNCKSRITELMQVNWILAKHMLGYLYSTIGYQLQYLDGDGVRLQGYSDSDRASIDIDRKSTFGCSFSLGSVTAQTSKGSQRGICQVNSNNEVESTVTTTKASYYLRTFTDGRRPDIQRITYEGQIN